MKKFQVLSYRSNLSIHLNREVILCYQTRTRLRSKYLIEEKINSKLRNAQIFEILLNSYWVELSNHQWIIEYFCLEVVDKHKRIFLLIGTPILSIGRRHELWLQIDPQSKVVFQPFYRI